MKKRNVFIYVPIIIMGVVSILFNGCKKEEEETINEFPVEIITNDVSNVTTSSVISGGAITDDGGYVISARGVCWNTNPSPTIANNKTVDGAGAGVFISNITGLTPNTKYYVRAYATNSEGTAYGSTMVFETKEGIIDPRDSNIYGTVTIGTQVWMTENLRYLPEVHNKTQFVAKGNSSQPGYGVYGYNGSIVNDAKATEKYRTYGVLYNWYAVNSNDVCPAGWHVPSKDEWITLTNYLGGEYVAGAKIKEDGIEHWRGSTYETNNESGFTALPGGFYKNTGEFDDLGFSSCFWSSTITPNENDFAWSSVVTYDEDNLFGENNYKKHGFSIRCIKD